jgi:hypothetical protein
VSGEGRSREQHVAEFPTTVSGLLTLRDWLAAFGVQQVVMEATGVFWKAGGAPRGAVLIVWVERPTAGPPQRAG